jgi:gamma-glutamyltranspeptidase / glutathione hydrolase
MSDFRNQICEATTRINGRIWQLAVGLFLALHAQAADRLTDSRFATRSEIIAPHAMAATSQPLATQIALDVMKAGGSAVDAAIAANAALGLMEPTGNGIGGDLFAIVWDPKTKKLHGYNGSGRSPQTLTMAEFEKRNLQEIPSFGPLPVTVPGAVDAWFALHQRFGKRSMAQNLAPAIQYARQGFPVSDVIAHYWRLSVPRLQSYPGFVEQFTVDGKGPNKGQMWKNPHLAQTLETLSKKGRKGFYQGEIADLIGRYFKAHGGFLTAADLAAHQGEWVEPISTDYRGYQVWELPPNGQGLAALQILEILERFDLAKMGFNSADYIHTFTEAKKLAFADRAQYYADPAFRKTPIAALLAQSYSSARAQLIDPKRAKLSVDAGDFGGADGAPEPEILNQGDTIYLTTADASGMMVSLIQSNFRGMGSGMAPFENGRGLGFILQDRGEQFVLKAGHANSYEPNKRPFHTIIPAFVSKGGQPLISFGVMGGGMQPQAHAQIMINIIDFGMNLQEAGDAPRIHHDGSTEPAGQNTAMTDGGLLNLETGFDYSVIRELMRRGHKIQFADGPYGGYQAIMRNHEQGTYIGASESRKDGQAAGY